MKQWTPEQIKAFRKKLDLYQKEFAELLGVTKEYICYLEKGVRTPSMTLKLFLNCLEKDLKRKEMKK